MWKSCKSASLYANPEDEIVTDMFRVVRTCDRSFSKTWAAHFKIKGDKANLRWRTLNYSLNKLDSYSKRIAKHKFSKDLKIHYACQAKEMFIAVCSGKSTENLIKFMALL